MYQVFKTTVQLRVPKPVVYVFNTGVRNELHGVQAAAVQLMNVPYVSILTATLATWLRAVRHCHIMSL